MSEETPTPTREQMLQSYTDNVSNAFGFIFNAVLRIDALAGSRPENAESVQQAQLNLKLASMWLMNLISATAGIIEKEDAPK